MLHPTSLVPALHLGRATLARLDAPALDRHLASSPTGVSVLEWGSSATGLFVRLRAAAEASCQVFPGRWFAAPEVGGSVPSRPERLFWVARNDAALARLFEEEGPRVDGGLPRPDDPLCLLGMAGDVLEGTRGAERERAARRWLHRLGHGRVALVAPAGDDTDVLARLADDRHRIAERHHRAGRGEDLQDHALVEGAELHRGLVRLDLGQEVVDGDGVAFLHVPGGDLALLHGGGELRHLD